MNKRFFLGLALILSIVLTYVPSALALGANYSTGVADMSAGQGRASVSLGGYDFIFYRRSSDSYIVYRTTSDSGANWSAEATASHAAAGPGGNDYNNYCVGLNGTQIYIFYYTGTDSTASSTSTTVYYRDGTVSSGTITWNNEVSIFQSSGYYILSVATTPNRVYLSAVCYGPNLGADSLRYYHLAFYSTTGATWTKIKDTLSHTGGYEPGQSITPWPSAGTDGVLMVSADYANTSLTSWIYDGSTMGSAVNFGSKTASAYSKLLPLVTYNNVVHLVYRTTEASAGALSYAYYSSGSWTAGSSPSLGNVLAKSFSLTFAGSLYAVGAVGSTIVAEYMILDGVTSTWSAKITIDGSETSPLRVACSADNPSGYMAYWLSTTTGRFSYQSVNIPTITIRSWPPSGAGVVSVDGAGISTNATYNNWRIGEGHELAAVARYVNYLFNSWNDTGAATHYVYPVATKGYYVKYDGAFYLTVVNGTAGGWYVGGNVASVADNIRSATATSRYNLYRYVLDGAATGLVRANTGTQSKTVTMNQNHTLTWSYYHQFKVDSNSSMPPFTITNTGDPVNDDWYDAGTSAVFNTTTPQTHFELELKFKKWVWSKGGVAQTANLSLPFTYVVTNYATISAYWSTLGVDLDVTGNATLTLDGSPVSTPDSFHLDDGSTHTVNGIAPPAAGVDLTITGNATLTLDGSPVSTPDTIHLNDGSDHTVNGIDTPGAGVDLDVTGNATITVDGAPVTTPDSLHFTDGSTHTVNAWYLAGLAYLQITGNATITIDGAPVTTPHTYSLSPGLTYVVNAIAEYVDPGLGGVTQSGAWLVLLAIILIPVGLVILSRRR